MNASMRSLPHLTMKKTRSPNKGSSSLFDMCDASTAVSIIQRYVDEHLFSPSFTWPKYEFRKRSYQQWAAYEICDRIMDKPFDDPITVIENFMFEMAMYACYGEDEQRSFIFQSAVETAEELSLLFV